MKRTRILPNDAHRFVSLGPCAGCARAAHGTLHDLYGYSLGTYCKQCATDAIRAGAEHRRLNALRAPAPQPTARPGPAPAPSVRPLPSIAGFQFPPGTDLERVKHDIQYNLELGRCYRPHTKRRLTLEDLGL